VAAALFLVACLAPAADQSKPEAKPSATDDVQDFVFLAEARPVLIRLHVRVDGKPVQAAWDDFLKYLFGHLDINGDGVLSKEEAERVPSVDQIVNGNLGGFVGLGAAPAPPSWEELDADKDGKVTPAELAAYYRKKGLEAFQFQLSPPPGNPFGAAAFLGGSRAEPSAAAVSEAIFTLLDTNKDGKLTKDELAAAPDVLLRLDEDEDEIITARELVPNAAAPANPFAGMQMMGGAQKPGSASKVLVPVTIPGEAPADLVRFLQERYGPKVDKPQEKRLSRKDLGLDEATFTRLDANGDGVLDAQELAAFVKRAPDLELLVRLGRRDGAARVELVKPADGPSLAGNVEAKDGLALLDLGVTRLDLRTKEEDGANAFGGILRQQYVAQFRQADKDNNGYLDEMEAKASRTFRSLFKAMDRDGDGKVTEKELMAYLDWLDELQKRAAAGCATLVLSDDSRGLFDLLDVNRDGRLSVREMRGAVKLLGQLDRDGKGFLTKADIPRLYQVTLRRGSADRGSLGGAAAFFELYRVSARYDAEEGPARGPLWFRKMDRNRDGDVSRKEFLFGEEEFRKIDTDGDGLISMEEAERYDALRRKEK
jgi:Ca2+-binding EF-hand superfamily protein